MKMLKSALLLLLISFILIGSGGVRIFTHYCEISGTSHALFVEPEDPCTQPVIEKKSCCKEAIKCESIAKEDGCCNSETDVVQLQFQYFEYSHLAVPQMLGEVPQAIFHDFSPKASANGIVTAYNLPPPKLQGRDLGIINCVYRL